MKLALHRSITFWSGLLVMAFICWAWWDSTQYRSDARWKTSGGLSYWSASSNTGILRLTRARYWGGARWDKVKVAGAKGTCVRRPVSKLDWDWREEMLGGRPFTFRHVEARDETSAFGVTDHWIVTYPTLILLSSVLCAALLFWRARSRNKTVITP